MGEAAYKGSIFKLLRRITFFCKFDDPGEILGTFLLPFGNMFGSRIARGICGEKLIQVCVVILKGNDTVGGHEYGTVEGLELLVLMPPGTAIVSYEVVIFLESGVVVCRKHLAMSIDVNTCPLCLF